MFQDSLVAQMVKNPPAMQESQVLFFFFLGGTKNSIYCSLLQLTPKACEPPGESQVLTLGL